MHLVCKYEVKTPTASGGETASIDISLCDFAAVAYGTEESNLSPGNRLKQGGYHFPIAIATCDDSGSAEATRPHARCSEYRTNSSTVLLHTSLNGVLSRKLDELTSGNPLALDILLRLKTQESQKLGYYGLQSPCSLM
jgi:hypothetical protein